MRLIKADEVQSKRRGRTATYDQNLLDVLGTIESGTFGVLEAEDLPQIKSADAVPATSKDAQSVVNGVIRKHYGKVFGADAKCSIKWTVDGFPQVGAAKV